MYGIIIQPEAQTVLQEKERKSINKIRAQSISSTTSLLKIVCVFNQTLYAKVTEILWKNAEKVRTIIVRMGAFHTICNFIETIGKRFKDVGLRDIAFESAVIAEGSIEAVLDDRHYNRAARLRNII